MKVMFHYIENNNKEKQVTKNGKFGVENYNN
jgi:hypothetical protein